MQSCHGEYRFCLVWSLLMPHGSEQQLISTPFHSRQVANETGDSRRALQLLSRAVDLAERNASCQAPGTSTAPNAAGAGPSSSSAAAAASSSGVAVQREHVRQAIEEMFETVHMKLLRGASRLEKMLLVAVVLEMRATSRPDVILKVLRS